MPDPIPPMSDPEFQIYTPTNGSSVGPNFSVTGAGPKNMQNLTASAGSYTNPAAQESDGFNWEAPFSNLPGGPVNVSASYANGSVPPTGTTITVTVLGNPGLTITGPTSGGGAMADATGGGNKTWGDYNVSGTYDPAKIGRIQIFVTRQGMPIQVILGRKAAHDATINAMQGTWTCNLGFIPPGHTGDGYIIHWAAAVTLSTDLTIFGIIPTPFTGPS